MAWISVNSQLPPQDKVVNTKIEENGESRNETKLRLRGAMWWQADGKLYVYYTPTHWQYL